jgi:WD40 repeat protein
VITGPPTDPGLTPIDFVDNPPQEIRATSFEHGDFEVVQTTPEADSVFTPSFLGAFKVSDVDISAIDVTSSGQVAYVGTQDGSIYEIALRSSPSGQASATSRLIIKSPRPISSLALSPDGNRLAVSQFSQVSILDLQRTQRKLALNRVAGRLGALTWDPKGELVAFGRETGEAFVWNLTKVGGYGGGNNVNSVEQYGIASDASVVKIAFHPLGRSFYMLQQNGVVRQWRLLRTESELGLRDEWAVVDREPIAEQELIVGYMPGRGEDFKVSPDGDELVVSDSVGNIKHWRLRGLYPREDFFVGADSSTAFEILPRQQLSGKTGLKQDDVIITAGRGFFLKANCWSPYVRPDKSSGQVKIVTEEAQAEVEEKKAAIVGGLLVSTEEPPEQEASVDEIRSTETSKYLLSRSPNLTTPVSILKRGRDSAVLWGVQKKGTLLVFDFKRAKLDATCKR